MTIKQYYQDELRFLREHGAEFVDVYPKLASFLGEESADPDVERLLEGFAFLVARLRQKVDDQFPELTHSVLKLLWPNYLKPIPSICMMQFTPLTDAITERNILPKDTIVKSIQVEGTHCEFKTTADVTLYPLTLIDINDIHTRKTSTISLTFSTFGSLSLSDINMQELKFQFSDEYAHASQLYLWFSRYLEKIQIEIGETLHNIDISQLQPSGLAADEALIPSEENVFHGYRVLQEYFTFPEKFLSMTLQGLEPVFRTESNSDFTIHFEFERLLPTDIHIDNGTIKLYCCPAINLFSMVAEPIKMDGARTEYPIVSKLGSSSQFQLYDVTHAEGWVLGKGGSLSKDTGSVYHEFESFKHDIEGKHDRRIIYYKVRTKEALRDDSIDHFISFVYEDEEEALHGSDVISLDINCTNGQLPQDLRVGDVSYITIDSPTFVHFKNISRPTSMVVPLMDGSLHWRLISNLSLNYVSLLDKDALTTILEAYDFVSHSDRQAERAAKRRYEGIIDIKTKPIDVLFKGQAVRGLQTVMTMNEEYFLSEGDLFLFSTVLAEFFSLYCSINSFHNLEVINKKNNESYRWDWGMKFGQQPLI